MKSQRNTFKWTGMTFLLVVFMSFTFLLPSVFAQEGDPSTLTPSETPPLPESTSEPLEIPEVEQEYGVQSLMSLQSNAELGGDWAAQVNISDTAEESFKPKIAADNNGNLHIIWRETVSGKQEIYYAQIDGVTESMPINVSNSPSFNSDSPQLVVDSAGTAHIIWQEQDNDFADDYEILYSRCSEAGCTSPATLSDGQACSSYTGDWKGIDPSIGIDGNDNLMIVWMSYEPINRIYTMYSKWSASGSPPSNRTGCHVSSGLYAYPMVAGDSSGNFHLIMMSYSYGIFYSKFTGAGWSANQSIGTGLIPVIHIDPNNKIHAAWWNTGTPPVYRSRESNGTTWSTPENVFSSTICSDLSLITDGDNLPRLACAANGSVYESSRQPGGWVASTIIQSMAGQPDLAKDVNGDLHLVWSDSRSGSWDTFYSPTYSCDGITPATTAGQAVFSVIENTPFLNYCKNLVEEVIYVPAKNGVEAFQAWADLASSATHEVAFTVMLWDKRDDSPYPGEDVLQGINALHTSVTSQASTANYPHGMTVRILLGVQFNSLGIDPFNPLTDQRFSVLEELQNLNIPIYETLSDGRVWKVEVGLYEFGRGSSLPPGTNSHVKLMVVDNNKMIVSGYHPQYGFQTVNLNAKNHDLGIKVIGPIAANGMAVFDSLWEGSEILCTEEDASAFDDLSLGQCHTGTGENPAHWFFVPEGDDIVLPLYRDNVEKSADQAVKDAIESADTQVYVLQNRVGVPGDENVLTYEEGEEWLNYADALLKEALENTEIRILLSKEDFNFNYYNSPSIKNFMDQYYQDGGQLDEGDIVRFYHPDGFTTPPGLHAKSFMIDGEFLVIGSQNFDHSAFGDNDSDLDLVEYSLGIEDTNTVVDVKDYLETAWNDSGKLYVIKQNESLEVGIQQASSKDVIIIESGVYEITDTIDIAEGLTIVGLDAILEPAATFSNQIRGFKLAMPFLDTNPLPLLRINGSNVTLVGLTIQGSPGYGVEIGDGSTAFENVYLSGMVFENNALGGVHVQGSASYTIENNTFVGGGSGVTITSSATATGIIRDNIFAGQNIAPVQIASTDEGTAEYSYNLFYDCAGSSCVSGWHTGNLGAASSSHDNLYDVDPLFVNPSIGDYQLSPNSPALDAGDPAILHEFLADGNGDGELRIDIGAFEYLGEPGGPMPTATPIVTPTPLPSATATLTSTPTSTPTTVNLYLHGSGTVANPSTLFLDSIAPTGTTAKYKDSASVNFNSGNLWKEVGAWTAAPAQTTGQLTALNNLQVWLGLKNSDDQGTNFDLRVEIYKNNTLVGSAESLCITGITRNPNLAKQIILPFGSLIPATFNGTTDVLSMKLKARIGTNGSGGMCGGHSNAVGLRLYFDASNRPSGFDGAFVP